MIRIWLERERLIGYGSKSSHVVQGGYNSLYDYMTTRFIKMKTACKVYENLKGRDNLG
jgi:hypothetical protein